MKGRSTIREGGLILDRHLFLLSHLFNTMSSVQSLMYGPDVHDFKKVLIKKNHGPAVCVGRLPAVIMHDLGGEVKHRRLHHQYHNQYDRHHQDRKSLFAILYTRAHQVYSSRTQFRDVEKDGSLGHRPVLPP